MKKRLVSLVLCLVLVFAVLPVSGMAYSGNRWEKTSVTYCSCVSVQSAQAAVLDDLQARDFISEARVAESVVHRRAAKLGTQRLVQELRGKGLDEDLVRATAERLRATELARAQAVWQQRFGGQPATRPEERARQMRFLAARGFAGDVVRRVVRGAGDEI